MALMGSLSGVLRYWCGTYRRAPLCHAHSRSFATRSLFVLLIWAEGMRECVNNRSAGHNAPTVLV